MVLPQPNPHPLKSFFEGRRIRLWQLSHLVGYSPSSLSNYLNGITMMPPGLERRLSEVAKEVMAQ
jgi:hypothetical protein